jgi:hypothetical protein
MPRCSGVLVPLLQSRCSRASRSQVRHICCSALRLGQPDPAENGRRSAINAEHSALIDTDSLRNSLDAIREANRTRLIRKVDQNGRSRRLSLPRLLEMPVNGLSKDAAVIENFAKQRKNKPVMDKLSRPLRRQSGRKPDGARLANVGKMPLPAPEWDAANTAAHFRTPWLQSVEHPEMKRQASGDRLAAEMHAFNRYFTPSSAEQTAVTEAVIDLEKHLPIRLGCSRLEVIGSRASGLASALSDIDVNILNESDERPDVVNDREKSLQALKHLARNIRRCLTPQGIMARCFSVPFLVQRARVPILTVQHLPTGLELQIQQSNQAYNTTQYAKAFVREYPNLLVLFRVLRQTLAIRGLNDGSSGGFSSYTLLNLLLASLRAQEAQGGGEDISSQLLHFLQFIPAINFRSTGIVVSPFELVARGKDLPYDNRGYDLYVQDAADPTNILGKSTTRLRDIQSLLVVLRAELLDNMIMWDQAEQSESEGTSSSQYALPRSLLGSLLEANYSMFQLNRATLLRAREKGAE